MYKKITKIKKVKEYSDVPFDDDDDDYKFEGDYICADVPLFLRLLEWAKEETNKDADLHVLATKLVTACKAKENVLTMDDYAALMQ